MDDDITCYQCGGKGHHKVQCPLSKTYQEHLKVKTDITVSVSDDKAASMKLKDGVMNSTVSFMMTGLAVQGAVILEAWSTPVIDSVTGHEVILIDYFELGEQIEVCIANTYKSVITAMEMGC